jgi:hypothetical protein
MKHPILTSVTVLAVLTLGCTTVPERTAGGPHSFSPNELIFWNFYGIGELAPMDTETMRMSEGEDSLGVMIISPVSYPGDVTLSYRVKAMNSASVLVALLSVSDPGEPDTMTAPVGYNGNIQWLLEEEENYFFAFHNAAHDAKPFIRRHPGGGEEGTKLTELAQNFMEPDIWYAVEVTRRSAGILLKVDGVTVLEAIDPEPLTGGRVGIRIRGTAETKAGCLIRDVRIRPGRE